MGLESEPIAELRDQANNAARMNPSKQFLCANWHFGHASCKGEGKHACKGCLLVLYCGRECQMADWKRHKADCKSPLTKSTWQPAWVVENRTPAFIGGERVQIFGSSKYFWGNVPALDVLRLNANEGEGYVGDLRLLFAASGDLRNVVKTIASLPEAYGNSVALTINDRDFDIVARNVMILFLALVIKDVDEAVDCIIHIWYSALVEKSHIDRLNSNVRPLIEAVCTKIANKGPNAVLGKTFTFGSRSICLVLTKEKWMALLSYFEVPDGLTAARAQALRTATTMAHERRDYRDREMLTMPRIHRVCAKKFYEDGILLPFGHPRDQYTTPNPTFFRNAKSWPMKDSAGPFDGWDFAEALKTSSGPARNDIYGKLFYYLRAIFSSFCHRLSSLDASFEFYAVDVQRLTEYLQEGTFDRIEVANISDGGYFGIENTLNILGPLLQNPEDNPHATLVTLFMNAVEEVVDEKEDIATVRSDAQLLSQYLPPKRPCVSKYDTQVILFGAARLRVRDVDKLFDRYMERLRFEAFEQTTDMEIKTHHTVVEQWPTRLKLQPGEPGAQEEFDLLLSSPHVGSERYVEWKKAA